jgi:hypothetical protein
MYSIKKIAYSDANRDPGFTITAEVEFNKKFFAF